MLTKVGGLAEADGGSFVGLQALRVCVCVCVGGTAPLPFHPAASL